MANEIYHRSNWGNAVNDNYWADVYEKYSATNKMYIRSDYYENSNETDKLMADIYPKPSILLTPTAYDNGKLNSVKPVGGENLLLHSNQFDTTWGLLNVNTPTNGFTGYDGSSDAWKLTTTGASFTRINQPFNLNGIHTASIYAKSAEWDYIGLFFLGVSKGVVISLIDGTVQNPIINYPEFYADAEDVGNGWYRISIAHTLSGSGEYRIYPSETNVYNGNSTPNEGIYIQDAQLEQGLVARNVIETTTSAVYGGITDNVPRIDYTDASCPSLLLEPTRTNLISHSEFIGQDISVNDLSIDNNETTSPEGLVNATMITTTATSQPRMESTVDYNSTYAISCFIKKNIGDYFGFGYYEAVGGNGFVRFNISSGLDTDITYSGTFLSDGKIVSFNNDWYRISAKITTGSSTGKSGAKFVAMKSDAFHLSDIGNKYYIYGLQLEEASYETSYIPTYSTSVSRNIERPDYLDVTNLTGSAFTIFLDYKDAIRQGSTANWMYLFNTNNQLLTYVYTSTLMLHSTSGEDYTYFTFGDAKVAFVYDGTNVKYFLNGTLVKTVTASTRWNLGAENYWLYSPYNNSQSTIKYNSFIILSESITDQEAINLTTT